jgi:hypothetical protein
MHGIELREQERRTIRLSAPRWPFSPTAGSMLPGSPLAAFCPEPVARNGFSLARNSCRLSATSIPGSKLPACYFARTPWSFCSPLRNFVRLGSMLQTAPVDAFLFGTCSSERPFTLLERLPASGPPFQGQSSWPIPSALHSVFAGLVRLLRSSTLFWLAPNSANSSRCNPLPSSFRAVSTVLLLSTPAWGFYAPPDQSVQADYQPRGSPNRNARFPSLPATCFF